MSNQTSPNPKSYPCEHIPLEHISKNAITVIDTLKNAAFDAYLVGGGIRDLWVGKQPKDFDIVTDAHPEEIKRLFKRALLIGRRFKIVHVCFPKEIIEVSTFRSIQESSERVYTEHGTLLRDNLYGNISEDAQRRDFTVNALYFDVSKKTIIDYVEGFGDLEKRIIRMIGDPILRYQEDPLRMLRAIRLSAKLQFDIDPETEKPISELSESLSHIPSPRLLDELIKIYRSGHALEAAQLLKKHNLFYSLFSFLNEIPTKKEKQLTEKIIGVTLLNADNRVKEEKTLSTGLLFASFLWYSLQINLTAKQKKMEGSQSLNSAIHETLSGEKQLLPLTKKMKLIIREIWVLQYFFLKNKSRQIYHTFHHRYFRNAYHLMNFRIATGEENLRPLFDWWTAFIEADSKAQKKLIEKKQNITL